MGDTAVDTGKGREERRVPTGIIKAVGVLGHWQPIQPWVWNLS